MRSRANVGAWILVAILTGGCRIVTLDAPASGGGHGQGQGGAAGGGGGGGGGEIAVSPTAGDAANHHLEADDWFVAESGYAQKWIYVYPAKQESLPTSTGEATFRLLRDTSTIVSKHFWRTRAARPDELAVGALAIVLDAHDNGTYRAPTSRDEARKSKWFMARIASVSELSRGYIQVADHILVSAGAVRLIEGDESPRLVVGGALDEHFLQPDHWLAGTNALPEKTAWTYVYVTAAVQPPSKETGHEGEFLWLRSGGISWTRHAWHTRKAERSDLRVGQLVFVLEVKSGDAYRAPASHREAIGGQWFAARITDTSKMYKGVVEVAGQSFVALDAMRVVVE